jgi:hypothetical protein
MHTLTVASEKPMFLDGEIAAVERLIAQQALD